ncbi:MAG: hypothetical protein ABSF00_02175 [Candidatus Bathyarchaeia archaeon]
MVVTTVGVVVMVVVSGVTTITVLRVTGCNTTVCTVTGRENTVVTVKG